MFYIQYVFSLFRWQQITDDSEQLMLSISCCRAVLVCTCSPAPSSTNPSNHWLYKHTSNPLHTPILSHNPFGCLAFVLQNEDTPPTSNPLHSPMCVHKGLQHYSAPSTNIPAFETQFHVTS